MTDPGEAAGLDDDLRSLGRGAGVGRYEILELLGAGGIRARRLVA